MSSAKEGGPKDPENVTQTSEVPSPKGQLHWLGQGWNEVEASVGKIICIAGYICAK